MKQTLCLIAALTLVNLAATADDLPDFGDDSSPYANDAECDDPRFEGPGMTATRLLNSDRFADASDCQAAWVAGDLSLKAVQAPALAKASLGDMPDFGDDSGSWANDGECDDPRFEGPGMTTTPLLDEDRFADASDCQAAWVAGDLSLKAVQAPALAKASLGDMPDFGDDSGSWANDGECDDPRFEGPGMTTTPLLDEDRFADASDCQAAWVAGNLQIADN